MLKLILVLAVFLTNTQLCLTEFPSDLIPVVLLPDSEYRCCSENETKKEQLIVYCYHGKPKRLTNLWKTVSAYVDMNQPEKYDLYVGKDESDVWTQYESSQSKWIFNILNWGRKSISMNPFNTTCFGIKTSKNYTLKIHVTEVNIFLVVIFTVGALLFFLAPILVQNQVFYYVAGISIGVLASVLILLYFLITLMPLKRPAMLGLMAGGSTIVLYFFQSLLDNMLVILPLYWEFVYGYFIVSGFISFLICYRFGPLTNPRSKNIVQWSLQILSLALIFYSSHIKEVTNFLAVAAIILYKFPITKWVINGIRSLGSTTPSGKELVKSCKKSKLIRGGQFLTEKGCHEQVRIETDRGIKEIRRYCSTTPLGWRAVQRIKTGNYENFAKFVSGNPHVSIQEDEAKIIEELLTDDED